jgi:hypothetical protein
MLCLLNTSNLAIGTLVASVKLFGGCFKHSDPKGQPVLTQRLLALAQASWACNHSALSLAGA